MSYSIIPIKFLAEDEDAALQKSLANDPCRDSLMLLLLRFCGMRPSELLGLRVKDVLKASQEIFVRGLKGSDDRTLPVPYGVFLRIQGECRGKGPDDLVFGIGYPRLVQIWDWWRPVEKPLKSLRHTFGVTYYQKTKDILLVQRAMGHKDLKSTLVYQTYVGGQERFRETMW